MENRREIPPIVPEGSYLGCKVVALSDVGTVREENQDFMGYFRLPDAQLLVVADGMGGHSGGFEASRIVVAALRQVAAQSPDTDPAELLYSGICRAHELVRQASDNDPSLEGMGSTVVALLVRGDRAWIAHVGDSRIYLLRAGVVERLTRDHTRVNRMVEEGMIPAEAAKDHPMGHILERSIGAAEDIQPEVRAAPLVLRPGDRLLLCSDGFTNMVPDEELSALLSRGALDEVARSALNLALERGADDNTTLALLEFQGAGAAAVGAPKPARASAAAPEATPGAPWWRRLLPLWTALLGVLIGGLLHAVWDSLSERGVQEATPETPSSSSGGVDEGIQEGSPNEGSRNTLEGQPPLPESSTSTTGASSAPGGEASKNDKARAGEAKDPKAKKAEGPETEPALDHHPNTGPTSSDAGEAKLDANGTVLAVPPNDEVPEGGSAGAVSPASNVDNAEKEPDADKGAVQADPASTTDVESKSIDVE